LAQFLATASSFTGITVSQTRAIYFCEVSWAFEMFSLHCQSNTFNLRYDDDFVWNLPLNFEYRSAFGEVISKCVWWQLFWPTVAIARYFFAPACTMTMVNWWTLGGVGRYRCRLWQTTRCWSKDVWVWRDRSSETISTSTMSSTTVSESFLSTSFHAARWLSSMLC